MSFVLAMVIAGIDGFWVMKSQVKSLLVYLEGVCLLSWNDGATAVVDHFAVQSTSTPLQEVHNLNRNYPTSHFPF